MDRAALEQHIRDSPVDGTPAQMRAGFLRLSQFGVATELPDITKVAGCPGRWFGVGDRPILWLHGGGYVFGGSESHAAAAAALSQIAGRRVFVPDYPLVPDCSWPTLRDTASAVLQEFPDADVVGDSAGGHLALVLAARTPGAMRRLAVLSPNTDRSGRSDTRESGSETDLMNDAKQDRRLSDMALGKLPDDSPEASPLLADPSQLPPLFMSASSAEVLLDDTLLFASHAARAGVPVTLKVRPALFHMWHLWPDALPEARETLSAVAEHLA